jgi:hypothetical protein
VPEAHASPAKQGAKAKGKWDLTSTHSLAAAAEWLRERSDALVVLVIRPKDGALAVDPLIDVIDVKDRVWEDVPKLLGELRRIRDEERTKQLKREAKR